MSESSRTDDSAPSLSTYPPAFVSLITTFIKRAEEAEARAHKSLVILRTKDRQMARLQQRMQLLEKIASRLEEVMVPPLDLPPSPPTSAVAESPAPRDPRLYEDSREHNQQPQLETLYERYPTVHLRRGETDAGEEVHNCYARCQHLIDGLERSNCQLREAFQVESRQRLRDREWYETSIAQLTSTVKSVLAAKEEATFSSDCVPKTVKNGLSMTVLEELTSVLAAAGDTKDKVELQWFSDNNNNNSEKSNVMAILNKTDFMKTVAMAENVVQNIQNRLEKAKCKVLKRSKSKRRAVSRKCSKVSLTSNHTPNSMTSFKTKPRQQSFSCYFTDLKKKNKRLKSKYQHICERFKESLSLCGKLHQDVTLLTKNAKQNATSLKKMDGSTQTENNTNNVQTNERGGRSRSVYLLQGRLDAAAKVMAKQCHQIQDLQNQLVATHELVDSLKKRVARAETAVAGKDMLIETTKKQLQDSENQNCMVSVEVQQLRSAINRLKQELSSQIKVTNDIEKQKEDYMEQLEEIKMSMESKLASLSGTLLEQEELNERATAELGDKLNSLKEQFVVQISEARDRLTMADCKIQELYGGIESFLRLLFSLYCSPLPELSPLSQAQAVQMASDILELGPGQVQTILHSARGECPEVNKWLKECNQIVHTKNFAQDLGHFLLDAVFEARTI